MSTGLVSTWSKVAYDCGDTAESEGKSHFLLLKNLPSDYISRLFPFFFAVFRVYFVTVNNLDPEHYCCVYRLSPKPFYSLSLLPLERDRCTFPAGNTTANESCTEEHMMVLDASGSHDVRWLEISPAFLYADMLCMNLQRRGTSPWIFKQVMSSSML